MAKLEQMHAMIRRAHDEAMAADSGPYAFGSSRTDQVVCALSSLDEAQLRKKIDEDECSVTRDASIHERVRSLSNPRPCTRFANRTHWDCEMGFGPERDLVDEIL